MAAIFTLEAPNLAVFDARMLVEKYGCPSSNSMATIKVRGPYGAPFAPSQLPELG